MLTSQSVAKYKGGQMERFRTRTRTISPVARWRPSPSRTTSSGSSSRGSQRARGFLRSRLTVASLTLRIPKKWIKNDCLGRGVPARAGVAISSARQLAGLYSTIVGSGFLFFNFLIMNFHKRICRPSFVIRAKFNLAQLGRP